MKFTGWRIPNASEALRGSLSVSKIAFSLVTMSNRKIVIEISSQTARLMEDGQLLEMYPISSAANGTGYEVGSHTTPLGRFKIYKKIGAGCEMGAVFKSRIPTGEVCTNNSRSPLWQSNEDLVLTRILWLEGADTKNSNTKERYIYLHGTNQEHLLGQPASHGCIRLSNIDIKRLFDQVDEGTEVIILA